MDRNRIKSSEVVAVATNGTIAVRDAQLVCFTAVGATAFKVQGSSDGGSTYNDIEGSAQTSDGTPAQRNCLDLFRCHFDHLKVVMTGVGAICVIERRGLPSVPPYDYVETRNELIVDPQLGTA